MANNYFQFKQFTIQQDQCAMKVTTDGCLFGAMAAANIQDPKNNIQTILDIGTGTGLLSLMLAQKSTATIDAVEIDEATSSQAKENFDRSPWKERLNICNADITVFSPEKKYDCIITNPPFFEDDLRSSDVNKNNAKHDTALTLKQLLQTIDLHLKEDGIFFILLPFRRAVYFEKEAALFNFSLAEKLNVRQTPRHNHFRSILLFTRKEMPTIVNELTIKGDDNQYTAGFIDLLKDFYLHL
jgi:tRNA1Val (adenine37-N6)-methyltransferase